MKKLILIALLAGCAVDVEPQVYTCTVVYRCTGAPTLEARLALPCAADLDEAEDIARDATLEAMVENCGAADAWQHVRAICAPYENAIACN